MKRNATASWSGGLKNGNGTLTTGSGVLQNTPYSFATRFADKPGTNPEELIAAAHAGCFTMALSAELEGAGFIAEELTTDAEVTLEKVGDAWTVTKSDLKIVAKIPGIENDAFQKIADGAKKNCPISRLLNAKISLDAQLEPLTGP